MFFGAAARIVVRCTNSPTARQFVLAYSWFNLLLVFAVVCSPAAVFFSGVCSAPLKDGLGNFSLVCFGSRCCLVLLFASPLPLFL